MKLVEPNRAEKRRSHRFPFIKFIQYDGGGVYGAGASKELERDAAVVNVSNEGVCLLLKEPLEDAKVIRISLPASIADVTTPTLAEVKWVKKMPWAESSFVGCRFLI